MKKKEPSFKAQNLCVVMTLAAAVLIFAAGIWQMSGYKALMENCTRETTGVIINEAAYSGKSRIMERIEVRTDEYFHKGYIYVNNGTEKIGETVVIHYDKDNTDRYYINDRAEKYKYYAVSGFVISVVMLILTAFLAAVIRRRYVREKRRK